MKFLKVAGIALVLLVGGLAALPFLIDANQFKPRIEAELTKALGREVKLGDLKLSILSGGVAAGDLSIADDPAFSHDPFVKAKSLKIGVELLPLLMSHKLNVTGVTLDSPDIALIQTLKGDWNYATLGSKTKRDTAPSSGPPLALSVKFIRITNGRLSLSTLHGHSKTKQLEQVQIEVDDFSPEASFPYSFSAKGTGGADLKLKGKAGPIDSADTSLTPVQATLSIAHLDLVGSGILEPSAGIAGIISLDGDVTSTGRKVDAKGRIKAEHLKLAKNGTPAQRLVEFDFTVDHNVVKREGALQRGLVHVGKAEANLTGTYAMQGEDASLNMHLAGPAMPTGELEAMLPALGVVLPSGSSLQGGAVKADLRFEGPLAQLRSAGEVGLSNSKLVGFDLGSKMKTVAALTGIKVSPDTDIQTFLADVKAGAAGVDVPTIKLVVPDIGQLDGSGTVSPAHALDFKMHLTLHSSGGVLTAIGSKGGDVGVPFSIRGSASSPTFVPDVKGMAKEEIKSVLKSDTAVKAAEGILGGLLGGKKK